MLIRIFYILVSVGFFIATQTVMSQTQNIDSLLNLYQKVSSDEIELSVENQVQLYNHLGNYYRFKNNDSLKYFADKALRLNSNKSIPVEYIKSVLLIGDYQSDSGRLDEAMVSYKKADNIISSFKNPKLRVDYLKRLSISYFFSGQLKEMLSSTYKAIELCQINNLVREEAILRHNLGFIYCNNNMHEEAHKELITAVNLSRLIKDDELLSTSLSNLALSYVRHKDFDNFLKFSSESYELLKLQENPLWISRNFRLRAEYNFEIGNLNESLKWLKKGDSILRELNNPRDELENLNIYSKVYSKKKDFQKSEEYALKILNLAKKLNDTAHITNALKSLRAVYALGPSDKALYYNEQYDLIQSNFKNTESNKSLKFYREILEYEREQNQISMANSRKIEMRNQWIFFAFILILGFVAIAYFVRIYNDNHEKATIELTQQSDAKDQVFSIIGHDLKSPISTLQELLELYDKEFVTQQDVIKLAPRLKENVDYSSFTLNNLLYWAKSQMNGLVASPKKIQIEKKFEQVCSLYRLKIKEKNLEVNCSLDTNHYVLADPDHLDIIFRNVMSNAIKFSNIGGRIDFKIYTSDNNVIIEVIDQGVGMSKQKITEVHSGLALKATSGTMKEKGTGIGLQIIKELLSLNKGSFSISSYVSTGTCVTIRLPKA